MKKAAIARPGKPCSPVRSPASTATTATGTPRKLSNLRDAGGRKAQLPAIASSEAKISPKQRSSVVNQRVQVKPAMNAKAQARPVGKKMPPKEALPQDSVAVRRGPEQASVTCGGGGGGDRKNASNVNKVKREKVAVRPKRRGYNVSEVQTRRKVIANRGYGGKRNSNHIDPPASAFPLINLEEYLKQRGCRHRNGNAEDDIDSQCSNLSHLQKSQLMLSSQRIVFGGDESTPRHSDQSRRLPKLPAHAYASANDDEEEDEEEEEDMDICGSDRSGCGMLMHWGSCNSNSGVKNESLLHYAGSCFSVSKRRSCGRRNRGTSDRSMSSLCSDSETAPLMTEPEPFHDYSDELTASSVESDTETPAPQGELHYGWYRENMRTDAGSDKVINPPRRQRDNNTCKHRSLSQKYRPKSFKDLIGQNMVTESLSNAILRSKIAPLYLFHGPRGTGKTSAAKIFTCAMNCLSIEELRPCGLCKACLAFNAGNNYDVKEIDAAGNCGIESMKLILKHISLPPTMSRYKVFIMDDCHMLTPEAWNALLKSLEEPSDYVVFILITTNLEQLPRTAISRCQKFMFARIKDADIVLRLRELAHQEKIDIDAEALQFIASHSDGSFRDAETMLDQLSLLGKRVTLGVVREMMGLIPDEELLNLLQLALSSDTVNTVDTVRELMGSGVEPLALVSQFATFITELLAGKCRSSGVLVRRDQQDRLQKALRILSDVEKQLHSCTDRSTWLTAAFLQLASNDLYSRASSSRATSTIQSPQAFHGLGDKLVGNQDPADRRCSWGAKEKWELQLEEALCGPLDSCGQDVPGPYVVDNRVHPCDQSPQLDVSVDEKTVDWKSPTSPSTMSSIWRKVIEAIQPDVLKQILQVHGKLTSLSVTEDFTIAQVEFRSAEHKSMAVSAKENLADAFRSVLSCQVKLEIGSSSIQEQSRTGNSTQRRQEYHSKREIPCSEPGPSQEQVNERGSQRRASGSFRNVISASLLGRSYHDTEDRKSKTVPEIDDKACKNTYVRDLSVCTTVEDMPCNNLQQSAVEDAKPKVIRSTSVRSNDSRGEDCDEYTSDSEIGERYSPGLLCWKGTRIKNGKDKAFRIVSLPILGDILLSARHHVLRRRRARFLVRLVPCAKEETQS